MKKLSIKGKPRQMAGLSFYPIIQTYPLDNAAAPLTISVNSVVMAA